VILKDFKRAIINVPPLKEQRTIAHILGTLDDKIELNRKQNETLEAMARALFKAWFVDFEPVRAKMEGRWVRGQSLPGLPAHLFDLFPDKLVESELGEIPDGWEVTDFGSVSKCLDKHRIPLSNKQRECRKGVIPYHGATSVMDFVDEYIFDGIYLLLGEDGSVLKEDGTPFIQYIWGKSWVNNHAHVLQGLNDVSTEHLMLFIAAQNITAYVTGAVQLKLNQKNMNSIPFLKARSEINSEFAELIAPFYDQYRELSEQSRTLSQLRDTLLPKLISGELRVPSVMIEGIT
jgi:type I restriction enzyme S subunit